MQQPSERRERDSGASKAKKVSVQKTRPKLTSPTSSATSLALSSTVASETSLFMR
ncbi:hypothetical protein ACE6H2_006549 [Prunus campanulata]